MLGGKWHPIVDWAEIDPKLDPDEMEKVTCLFLCGFFCHLKGTLLEFLLSKFVICSYILVGYVQIPLKYLLLLVYDVCFNTYKNCIYWKSSQIMPMRTS